jgi:hypothetical protein
MCVSEVVCNLASQFFYERECVCERGNVLQGEGVCIRV